MNKQKTVPLGTFQIACQIAPIAPGIVGEIRGELTLVVIIKSSSNHQIDVTHEGSSSLETIGSLVVGSAHYAENHKG